jgi:hypothetical protein
LSIEESGKLATEGAGAGVAASAMPEVVTVALSIDSVADAALTAQRMASGATELRCDACDEPIDGEPSGRGLYMWTRGEEVRFEEPALCPGCATAIGVTALAAWSVEEEEG